MKERLNGDTQFSIVSQFFSRFTVHLISFKNNLISIIRNQLKLSTNIRNKLTPFTPSWKNEYVVPENIHIPPPPPPPHGMVLEIRGRGSLEVQISKGCGGKKSNIFPESPRALSERNLPISHLRFNKSTNQ